MGLRDIQVKIDRAREHLREFEGELDRFVSEKPWPLHVVTHGQASARVWDVEWTRDIPRRWSALVGDCVHNLRCALDHIVWDLSGGDEYAPVGCEFPVFTDPLKFFRAGRDGKPTRGSGTWKIRGVVEDDAHREFSSFQPFRWPEADRSRHPLWVIHELDRIDKHRSLTPVWGRAHDYRSLLANGIRDESDLPPGWRKLKVGATQSPFYRHQTPPGVKTRVKIRYDLAIRVVLPNAVSASSDTVDVLLKKLILFVDQDVLETFRPYLE